ncbi:coilin [Vigna unguiculata]|uniref:coilin n=1 Tax=Vigna unguiculata TaxID=3917 RepID=UPI0010170A95|nr:coilin [Vigna unguiculata]
MAEMVRLRVVFEDPGMLSKSKKKEGLNRCWFLLKPQHSTISDVASHLHNTFRLHRTCPRGIILSMDGFVIPSFESTCILKDKDIICVKRKVSTRTDDEPAMLPPAPGGREAIELPNVLVLANESFQEESGAEETMSQEDDHDKLEDADYVECKSDGTTSKKRKAPRKLKSPSQKKIKLSTSENLSVIPEVHEEENEGSIDHQLSLVKKDKKKSSKLSSELNRPSNLDKQKNDKSDCPSDETRFVQPQDESGTKKLPSRSARRKKAKRRWLRELKLQKEKQEKIHQTTVLEKDAQVLPIKDNSFVASDVHKKSDEHQQSDEESEEDDDDDIVPVEIRPGHIRFEPLKKDQDQAVPQNQFSVETFQWNGITNKKKGQKWGKERMSFHKHDGYEHSSQEYATVENAEKEPTFNVVDFDKLQPYTGLPKEGDVIAYRLVELSESFTPELSSFRVGKISQYDAKTKRIWLELVLEYPFDFKKETEKDASSFEQPDASPYQEDGSLEIDYASLVDVRMVKHGHLGSKTAVVSGNAFVNPTKATNGSTDEKLKGNQTTLESCQTEKEVLNPAKENGEVDVWEEISKELEAKKAKLSQDGGWSRGESSSTRSWSHRAMRCSALGPTMAFLRSNNGI